MYRYSYDYLTKESVYKKPIIFPGDQLFYGTIAFSEYWQYAGPSPIKVHNSSDPSQKFAMGLKDLVNMLRTCFVQYGRVTGTFRILKRSRTWSLSFVRGQPTDGAINFEDITK